MRKHNREQKLVDICFSAVLTATDPQYAKVFSKMTMQEKADWVAAQLSACGFPTDPCGCSWGVLR
jgi:hypothetical protein